jgi:hypothetical protein
MLSGKEFEAILLDLQYRTEVMAAPHRRKKLLDAYRDLSIALTRAEQRIRDLEVELEDGNAAYRQVIEERCAPDELHCTCVPHLRQRIKELESELATFRAREECKA